MNGGLDPYRMHVTVGLAAAFLLLFAGERLMPLRSWKRGLWHRLLANGTFSFLVLLVGATLVRAVGLGVASWTTRRSFGLLPMLSLPTGPAFLAGFLLMDLTFYYWHWANHRLSLLWRFHNVHHVDPDLDVTTSFRFHPVEIFYSTGFRVIQVGLLGVSPLTYGIYEVAFTLGTMFHHSNLRMPIGLERAVNLLFVTPRMHGIHHSQFRDETNSNYGVVFRWWDRLHRSLQLDVPQANITIGVPAYQEETDNRIGFLILAPFRRQREYWPKQDGSAPQRDAAERAGSPTTIAE